VFDANLWRDDVSELNHSSKQIENRLSQDQTNQDQLHVRYANLKHEICFVTLPDSLPKMGEIALKP
jgi:hypothetical protein